MSLNEINYNYQLERAGAHKDEKGNIGGSSCSQCGYTFDKFQAIEQFACDYGVDFSKACLILHGKSNPLCDFLSNFKGK